MKTPKEAMTKTLALKILIFAAVIVCVSCSGNSGSASAGEGSETLAVEEPYDSIGELISRVRATDRLYTSEYQVHKLVSFDDVRRLRGSILGKSFDLRLPQGERKVLIPVEAVIKGYIDFDGFSPDNVSLDSGRVTVILPDPGVELTSTKIDHGNIKEFTSYARPSFTAAELSMLEKQGRAAIVSSIPQMGIIEDARVSAYHVIVSILTSMGYETGNISVEFRSDLSPDDYLGKIIRIDRDYQ